MEARSAEQGSGSKTVRGAQSASRSEPTLALALGGGGARGLAHIHVIEALDELGVKPVTISGSSIGAIMGAAMASGMSGREIRAYNYAVLGDRREMAVRMWRARKTGSRTLFSGNFALGQFDIEQILASFMPETMPKTFEELSIPLKITGTDYYGHHETVFREGDLISAIAASAAVPALFRPVTRDGRIYIDGGIFNPVPFDLVQDEADMTLAIDVVGAPEGDHEMIPKTIDSMFGASQLMMQSITAMKMKARKPDIFIRPPVADFRMFDFLKIDQIMEQTAPVKDEIKHTVDAAIAFWQAKS